MILQKGSPGTNMAPFIPLVPVGEVASPALCSPHMGARCLTEVVMGLMTPLDVL